MDREKAELLAKPTDTIAMPSAKTNLQPQQASSYTSKSKSQTLNLQPFNPNTVKKSELLSMNLPPQLVNNWVNFRNKGAQYNSLNDVSKIYGIKPFLTRLENVMIFPKVEKRQNKSDIPLSQPNFKPLELNQADSSALTKVYGIGPVLAKRIIKFRSVLGGFCKFEQLYEVYGLDSSTIAHIDKHFYLDSSKIFKFNINATKEHTLSKHPYISRNQATLIYRYIQNHGPLHSTHDMRQIKGLKPSVIERISPYLTLK